MFRVNLESSVRVYCGHLTDAQEYLREFPDSAKKFPILVETLTEGFFLVWIRHEAPSPDWFILWNFSPENENAPKLWAIHLEKKSKA